MIDAFLQELAINRDHSTWLIMADWLEENNDPRHELARLRYVNNPNAEQVQRMVDLTKQYGALAPVRKDNCLSHPLALIPAGKCMNGDKEIVIEHPFYMGVFIVSTNQFSKKHGQGHKGKRAAKASIGRINELIDKLNKSSSLKFSLPTKEEWLFAARVWTTTQFWFGDEPDKKYVYFFHGKKSVRHGFPNPFGLYNMQCLEWQLCSDGSTYGGTYSYNHPIANYHYCPNIAISPINSFQLIHSFRLVAR